MAQSTCNALSRAGKTRPLGARGKGDQLQRGRHPSYTDAYLAIYDGIAQDADLLQVQFEDRRLSLPPEWLGEFISMFLTSVAAGIAANATYNGRGRIERALESLKKRRESRSGAREADPPHAESVELLERLATVPATLLGPATEAAVRDALVDAGVEASLAQPVAERVRGVLVDLASDEDTLGGG